MGTLAQFGLGIGRDSSTKSMTKKSMKSIPMRQEIVGKLSIVIASHSHPALAGWWARPANLTNRFNGFVAVPKPLKRLMRRQWPPSDTQLKQGVNERSLAPGPRRIKSILVSLSLTMLTACQAASSRPPLPPEPVSAGTVSKEYQESSTDARRKYDGREITVKGLTVMTAMMPPSRDEQGLVLLEERGANPARRVACWFSRDQAEQFSKIKAGQYITVKGIFNGEAGAELKFCKLVNVSPN